LADPSASLSADGFQLQYLALNRIADLESKGYGILSAALRLQARFRNQGSEASAKRARQIVELFQPPPGPSFQDSSSAPLGLTDQLMSLGDAIAISTSKPTASQQWAVDLISQELHSTQQRLTLLLRDNHASKSDR
jgi:hypothetical protein